MGTKTIPTPPTSLNKSSPLGGRWFRWKEIAACFWPGRGGRSHAIDPELAAIKDVGGVYVIAWSLREPPRKQAHTAPAVKYIGETNWFKGRMGGFGASAGFWGERSIGHSAGWSWPLGGHEKLWVAFFEFGTDLETHVASGLRCWVEGVALEEYRVAHGSLPEINAMKRDAVAEFEKS